MARAVCSVAHSSVNARVCAQRTDSRDRSRLTFILSHLVINNAGREGALMNSIVYIVGAVVIIVAILSFFGLR